MTQDTTVNNIPVGLSYNSRNKPVGIAELSAITLIECSATQFFGVAVSDATDTLITNPASGHVLIYNSSVNKWVNGLGAGGGGGGVSFLNDLGDVTIPSLAGNELLKYTGSIWSATPISVALNQYATTSTTASLQSQITTANGNISDINSTITDSEPAWLQDTNALSALVDVSAATPSNGNILVYNSATSKWNAVVNVAGVTDHGELTGLNDNDHPQYVLSETNLALSSLVESTNQYIIDNEPSWLENTNTLASLTDVTLTSPVQGNVLVYESGQWHNLASSVLVGGGVSDHGALTGLLDNDHPNYVLSATNLALSSYVESVDAYATDVSAYITANEAAWNQDTVVTDHGALTGLSDNDHPQYVLSATNLALSSYVTNVSSYISANQASWSVVDLSGLADVEINTLVDGQILVYLESDGGTWVNSSVSFGGGIDGPTYLSSILDVSAANPVNGDILVYNSSVSEWVTKPYIPLNLVFHADAGANATLSNQANSEQFFVNSNRNIIGVDLTNFSQVRLLARVITGSSSTNNPRLYVEYASSFTTTIGTYANIGTVAVSASLTTPTYVVSPWVDLVSGAKADVFVAILQHGGDGAADPALGPVSVQFR